MPEGGNRLGWPDGFGATRRERDALLVLAHLELRSPRRLHELAWLKRSASACLEAILSDGPRAPAVDTTAARRRLRELGVREVTPVDAEYPDRLLQLKDPPAWLFVQGRPLSEMGHAVAVVGARTCSPYGRDSSTRLASQLADAGITVVSGAAIGIDGAAHEGALTVGGYTVGVLGSGHDLLHPRTNERLIRRIASEGTVVSEYPPGTRALPRRFPARNRLIAGLSDGVIVVEGAAGSGSLQTADHAGEGLGRQLMAVPGSIDSPLSQAPHELIRNGAALVADADDVLAALGLFDRIGRSAQISAGAVGEDEKRILGVLSGSPASLESIAASTGLETSRALIALAGLELRGVTEARGGRYRLAPPPPPRKGSPVTEGEREDLGNASALEA